MSDVAVSGQGHADKGVIGQALEGATLLYPAPPASVGALVVAGVVLGVIGVVMLWEPETLGLNLSVWVASVVAAAIALSRRGGLTVDRGRLTWLLIGVVFAAGLTWRDAPPLKLFALGCIVLTFAIAAHRLAAAWVRRAGVLRYVGAVVLGSVHAWTAAVLACVDVSQSTPRVGAGRATGLRRAAAIARGLAIATPFLVVFGALFMSADAVFAELVAKVVHFDFASIVGRVLLFSILAWISTGYCAAF